MELWDIYDENKKRTGRTMVRNDWNMKSGDYHLTVLGIVTDDKGHFLITQRRHDKQWAPDAWEVPGGGVKAGETSEEAVRREVSEETGLDLTAAKVTLMDSYRNDSPAEKNNYFVDIYHIQLLFSPSDVHIQEEETEGFRLVSYEELMMLGRGETAPASDTFVRKNTTTAGKSVDKKNNAVPAFLHFARLEKAFGRIAIKNPGNSRP